MDSVMKGLMGGNAPSRIFGLEPPLRVAVHLPLGGLPKDSIWKISLWKFSGSNLSICCTLLLDWYTDLRSGDYQSNEGGVVGPCTFHALIQTFSEVCVAVLVVFDCSHIHTPSQHNSARGTTDRQQTLQIKLVNSVLINLSLSPSFSSFIS